MSQQIATGTDRRQLGYSALVGAVLLTFGVAGELVIKVQEPDGSVRNLALFVVFVAAFLVGAALLFRMFTGFEAMHRVSGADFPRSGRVGARVSAAGFLLLGVFAVVGLVSALVTGAPAEWSFLFFALGVLLLIVGNTALGFGLRRSQLLGAAGYLPWLSALGLLVAVTVPLDPWHDVGLLASFATWAALSGALIYGRPGSPGQRPAA